MLNGIKELSFNHDVRTTVYLILSKIEWTKSLSTEKCSSLIQIMKILSIELLSFVQLWLFYKGMREISIL